MAAAKNVTCTGDSGITTACNPKCSDLVNVNTLLQLRSTCANDDECAKLLIHKHNYNVTNVDSLRRKIGTCSEKVKKLKKNKSKQLNAYLSSAFESPEDKLEKSFEQFNTDSQEQIARKVLDQTRNVFQENRTLKRNCVDLVQENFELETEVSCIKELLQGAIKALESSSNDYGKLLCRGNENGLTIEIEKCKQKYDKKSAEVNKLSDQLNTAQEKLGRYNTRNVNKRMKRKDSNIASLKGRLSDIQEENEELKDKITTTNNINEQSKLEKIRLKNALSKAQNQVKTLQDKAKQQKETYEQDTFDLNQNVKSKEKEIDELRSAIELMETDTVTTFYNGSYSNEIRECCMALLTECNVSMNKLPDIVRTVLRTFTGKIPDRLPSKSLLSWMMSEAKVVASKHVATEMLKDFDVTSGQGSVLHQDATTKFHAHFEGAQVTLQSGKSLTIGLKNVAGGDGQTYFQAFKDMVQDLASALGTQDLELNKAKLICSIKHFMSDQCATNGVFNQAVEELRRELIPAVSEKFEQLNDDEKTAVNDMGKFASRLHLLANFGTDADKAMSSFEDSVTDGKNPYSFKNGESGTYRLCRTGAKALTKRGSDKAGVHAYWQAYLRGKQKKNTLISFHGHRINVAFHEGAAIYHHHNDIEDFLKDWPEPNGLLKSLLFDVREPAYFAGCRALGIFDKLVTGPFWRILEREGSILDLNEDLLQMQLTLARWAEDGSIPFSGEGMFGNIDIVKDDLYESLFKDSISPSEDALTIMALELLSSQLLILLERQARTQLPEGQYWNPSTEFRESAKNVPKTNTISERDMAVLDNLLRTKPAASALTLEVIAMCSKNKPFQWLRSLSDSDRAKVLEDAKRQSKFVKEEFKAKKVELEKKMENKLKEKKAKVEIAEQKEVNKNFNLSREIMKYGGPWTTQEVDDKEESLGKEYKKGILIQLKFHKSVLKSKGNKELFQESTNKRKYSVEELKHNLKIVIEQNEMSDETETLPTGLTYKTPETSRNEINERKHKLTKDLMKARERRKVQQQKNELETYVESPELLVGKKIQQKCVHENEHVWFHATVKSIYAEKENKIKTEFNITYEEEPDELWHFPLLVDMKNGDLLVE